MGALITYVGRRQRAPGIDEQRGYASSIDGIVKAESGQSVWLSAGATEMGIAPQAGVG